MLHKENSSLILSDSCRSTHEPIPPWRLARRPLCSKLSKLIEYVRVECFLIGLYEVAAVLHSAKVGPLINVSYPLGRFLDKGFLYGKLPYKGFFLAGNNMPTRLQNLSGHFLVHNNMPSSG